MLAIPRAFIKKVFNKFLLLLSLGFFLFDTIGTLLFLTTTNFRPQTCCWLPVPNVYEELCPAMASLNCGTLSVSFVTQSEFPCINVTTYFSEAHYNYSELRGCSLVSTLPITVNTTSPTFVGDSVAELTTQCSSQFPEPTVDEYWAYRLSLFAFNVAMIRQAVSTGIAIWFWKTKDMAIAVFENDSFIVDVILFFTVSEHFQTIRKYYVVATLFGIFVEDVPQLIASSATGFCELSNVINFVSSVLYISIELFILIYKVINWRCTENTANVITLPSVTDGEAGAQGEDDSDSVGEIGIDESDSGDSKKDV